MGTGSKLAQVVRDAVIPVVSRLSIFQRRFVQNLSELAISYAGSPIIEGTGNRYWDDSLRAGKGIGSRFLLLLGDDADPSSKEATSQFCGASTDLVELRCVRQSGLMLLRPDGYVAYTSAVGDSGESLKSIRSLLERQTI